MGGAKSQSHFEWKSIRGTGIPERSDKVQHSTLCARRAAGRWIGHSAVLALYRGGQDAFTPDDLCVLETIGAELGKTIEAARHSNASAATAR